VKTTSILLYDSLDKRKKQFSPIEEGKVKIYVCGPTTYDKSHVGHARVYIFFDVVRRFLEYVGYEVDLVINITDIDDKIIRRGNEEFGGDWQKVLYKYNKDFLDMLEKLKIKRPTVICEVTKHIQEIIEFIEDLIKKGYAYIAEDGVYFHVPAFKEYGKLSGINIQDPKIHRIEPSPYKKHPADFALWKFWKEGEPYWYSPWGKGRPGWHIECSAMASKYLGDRIDIHGGGADLIFPHHENEIAQSEAKFGHRWVNFWMHVGLVYYRGREMSKSIKNFVLVDEVLDKYPPEVLRFYILYHHYRKPMEFDWKSLEVAYNSWKKIVDAYFKILAYKKIEKYSNISHIKDSLDKIIENIIKRLANDFDTLNALNYAIEGSNIILRQKEFSKEDIEKALEFFNIIETIFGILPVNMLSGKLEYLLDLIVEVRNKLRSKRMYELSDEIREKLKKIGIELKDMNSTSYYTIIIEKLLGK